MKKFLAVASLAVLTLAGCGITEEEKVLPKKNIDLVALGDSLTVGVGDEEEINGYAGRLAQAMPTEMNGINEVDLLETAKKGRRSDELIAQIKSGDIDEELKTAEFITLTIGGNDLMKVMRENITALKKSNFDEQRPLYEKRYEEIFKLIRERNLKAPIVAIGVYNPLTVYTDDSSQFEEIVDEWNSDMKKVVESDKHAVFVAVEDLFISNKEKVYSDDYFHPNAKGYTNMTNRILDTLKKKDLSELSGGKIEMKGDQEDE
ncbi:MAG: hypothetical protein KBT36_01990 [Kurthia sp.]|nr:hypothetical protein [Candidatus Kurthia equi]